MVATPEPTPIVRFSAALRARGFDVVTRYCLVSCLILATCDRVAIAQQLLDYGTYKSYGIRKGILGNDYENVLAACIHGDESPLPASKSNARVSIVYSADQYEQAFHIDQNAKASFLGIGGGGEELHFGQETGHSGSAFDIVVEAYSEYPSNTVNNIKWDSPYDTMMSSGNVAKIDQVRQDCGDRYIETVFNEARLFAVLHVSSHVASSLTTFSGKVNGNVDIDVVTASASLGGDDKVKSANSAGGIGVEIYSEGLGGFTPTLAAVGIASADGLASIADKLLKYVTTLSPTGQPVKYMLSPLPGMQTGDLANSRIFDYLWEFKSYFSVTNVRLANVKSLESNDPRRIVFKQPQADAALAHQETALKAYLNKVSAAHDGCRKASALSTCVTLAASAGVPPTIVSVELPPNMPPFVGPFMLAIDGVPVPAGQASIVTSASGTTLLAAARTIQANATNVDVLAPIATAYLSFVDFTVTTPNQPYSPNVVGSHHLLAQDFAWPTYWKAGGFGNSTIHVLHADPQHPCNISNSGVPAESCLTNVGRVLQDMALADAAQHVIAKPPRRYDDYLDVFPTDCFGTIQPVPLLQRVLNITANSQKANELVARSRISLPVVGSLNMVMIDKEESYDAQTWQGLAQTRLSAFEISPTGPAGANPCIPHIP
jgi:hypothetical protein